MGNKSETEMRGEPIRREVIGDLLVVQPIHDKLLGPLQCVIKLGLCGIFPNLAFSHLLCNEL